MLSGAARYLRLGLASASSYTGAAQHGGDADGGLAVSARYRDTLSARPSQCSDIEGAENGGDAGARGWLRFALAVARAADGTQGESAAARAPDDTHSAILQSCDTTGATSGGDASGGWLSGDAHAAGSATETQYGHGVL